VIYHDGIRQWFELKLDKAQCGQSSIQLVSADDKWTALEVLRGCRVKSIGPLEFSGTGYYSLETYQHVKQIQANGAGARQPPLPDYSKETPDQSIQEYRVDMHIEYGREDLPLNFRVTSLGKQLRPWQAYASYHLTGSSVLYGSCGAGFVVDRVFGTPQANPAHFDEPRTRDDMAAFDPESAAASGKVVLDLSYTCVREEPRQEQRHGG
jgi:hypothetical protein